MQKDRIGCFSFSYVPIHDEPQHIGLETSIDVSSLSGSLLREPMDQRRPFSVEFPLDALSDGTLSVTKDTKEDSLLGTFSVARSVGITQSVVSH